MLFTSLDDKKINLFVNHYKINWRGKSASKFQFRGKEFFGRHFGHLEWFEEVPGVGSLSNLRFDFMCRHKDARGQVKTTFVELDSKLHVARVEFFHPTEEHYLESMERDSIKFLYCEKNNSQLIRMYEDDEPFEINWFNRTFNFPFSIKPGTKSAQQKP